MPARNEIHTSAAAEGQPHDARAFLAPGEPDAATALSGTRALAVLALVGVVLVVMLAPAAIVGFSMLDGNLHERFRSWLAWAAAPAHYLDFLRLGSSFAVTGLVATARENP
ncbi:MAG: hypothetical protein NVS1B3_04880 [Candidatus Dormibacteraceae bacterium]